MPSPQSKRTRIQRVAGFELPPSPLDRVVDACQRVEVLWRIGLCVLAALVLWVIVGGWKPPFAYWRDYTPSRNIIARVKFERFDKDGTERAKTKAANQARFVYEQDPSQLQQLRTALKNELAEVGAAGKLKELHEGVWTHFSAPPMANVEPPSAADQEREFEKFHVLLDSKEKRLALDKGLDRAFAELEQKGYLGKLEKFDEDSSNEIVGNQTEIEIHPHTTSDFPTVERVSDVLAGEAIDQLHSHLKTETPEIAQRVFFWMQPQLPKATLRLDKPATRKNQDKARDNVKPVNIVYDAGDGNQPLAKAGQPLDSAALDLLHSEYEAEIAHLTIGQMVERSLAIFGMFGALYLLSGFFIYARNKGILADFGRFAAILGLCVATVALCRMASGDRLQADWRAELIPLLLFAMTVAIAYNQELALLLTSALALVVVIALGQRLSAYITLLSASAAAIFLLGRIRSRTKLIYVGLCSGAVGMATAIGVGILDNQPFDMLLIREAARVGGCAIGAGFLMTGLLPFIEKLFGVLTDISLLEIGDPAHPLLQELVRRAPGTYNHSINVASIAEAAAEAIGAHALLVRIGAYFHDIGKMLKPGYFVENSGFDANRHEDLVPAMSTLIIIAHIKDGADLARQNHLPRPIVDFIQQHHGTTLVEYFYHRANEQSEANPDGGEVDESSYRYPGPKPQTKEAAVLMMADAVESASRALVDPAPARIEGLVHEIALKRLLDDQFDECGLTLQELQMIEDSLVKSLTAVYHGRVKYPDQRSA
jgi:putative nucleotidyltransferase with HDIG domain